MGDLVQQGVANLGFRRQLRQSPAEPDLPATRAAYPEPGAGIIKDQAPLRQTVLLQQPMAHYRRALQVHIRSVHVAADKPSADREAVDREAVDRASAARQRLGDVRADQPVVHRIARVQHDGRGTVANLLLMDDCRLTVAVDVTVGVGVGGATTTFGRSGGWPWARLRRFAVLLLLLRPRAGLGSILFASAVVRFGSGVVLRLTVVAPIGVGARAGSVLGRAAW